jgi:hypothetical protein
LAERDVTFPECCQMRYHNPLYSDGIRPRSASYRHPPLTVGRLTTSGFVRLH